MTKSLLDFFHIFATDPKQMKFVRTIAFAVVALFVLSVTASGQSFSSYYYDYKLLNPAFAGMKDKHIITTVYAGIPFGKEGAPQLVYGSYETSIPSIRSGVGALASYEQFGPVTIKHGGIFFSKQIPFNDRSGLRVGTQLFYRQREMDFSFYRSLTDEDPFILGVQEITKSVNVDLGLLYYSSIVNVGFSIKDVLKEDDNKRSFNAIISREFKIIKGFNVTPSAVFLTDFDDNDRLDINTIFEIKQWVLLGADYACVKGEDDVSFSAGVNIKDWVQVITHIYSAAQYRHRDRTDSKAEVMIRVSIPHRTAKK